MWWLDGGVSGGSVHDQQGVQASVRDQEEELCGRLKVKEKLSFNYENKDLIY